MSSFKEYYNSKLSLVTEELLREYNETCLYIINEQKEEFTKEEKDLLNNLRNNLPKMNYLSVLADAKTIKSLHDKRTGDQYITGILYLAPAKESGYDMCIGSDGCCRIGCLNTAGNPAVLKGKLLSRIRKAKQLHEDPKTFFFKLKTDITVLKLFADAYNLKLAIRLNGTSDYEFEQMIEFIKKIAGEGVTFYDYTKIVPKYKRYRENPLIHHTFSRSATNDRAAEEVLKNGGNVAYVFYQQQNILPEYYLGYKVINGDSSDLRFLDEREKEIGEDGKPKGIIIGLSAKGSVKGRGARARAIRRSKMWNKAQKNPKYIDSEEFKKDAKDYFGVEKLEDLLDDKDKLNEYQNFRKNGRLFQPDGGFEIIIDDLRKIKPEVFSPNYKLNK